jgi:glycosyltransferase involved in cell wall biosynthesis
MKKLVKKTVLKKTTVKKNIDESNNTHKHLSISDDIIKNIDIEVSKQNLINDIYQQISEIRILEPNKKISLTERHKKGEKISLVVCCMNRIENLKRAVNSWVDHEEVSEIIILDYGSKDPIEKSAIHKISNKIKLYRTETKYWHLSRAYNIAIQLATSGIILKMDSDFELFKGFFNNHDIKYHSFLYGGHCVGGFYGFCGFYKKIFFMVNGFNERIIGYGHDDKDLFLRLQYIAGAEPIKIKKEFIYHIPHSYISKIGNQEVVENVRTSCNRNVLIAKENPWTIKDKMVDKNVAYRIF